MARSLFLGLLAALFFSATFVVNRMMTLDASGHWVWIAALRFLIVIPLSAFALVATAGRQGLTDAGALLFRHPRFWMTFGTLIGCFYVGLVIGALFAPAWVVTATWQMTILATPIVLVGCYGYRLPRRGILFSGIALLGVVAINAEHATNTSLIDVFGGGSVILVAAFLFPYANQMLMEAQQERPRFPNDIPVIRDPIIRNPFACVLLGALGGMPFWIVLVVLCNPPLPTLGQVRLTSITALSSGLIATSIFYVARRSTGNNPYRLAAVDATQSAEVLFALAGEMCFIGGVTPDALGVIGIALIMLGIALFKFGAIENNSARSP